MTPLQEYDLEIKPTQIVRGQGLCKLLVYSINPPNNEPVLPDKTLSDETQIFCTQIVSNSWYNDIKFYLIHGTTPQNIGPKMRISLRFKYSPFQLINDVFFRKYFDGVLLHCLEHEESEKVLSEFHSGSEGSQLGSEKTSHKVLRDGYYWTTLFKYSHAISRKCRICQKVAGQVKKFAFPL
jgi:hypothetical protein